MSNIQEEHWLERTTNFLEQNILGVKLGIYGIALCGLGVAIRSVRPFKKFTSPKDIPLSFIDGHLRLNGKVLRVDYFPKTHLVIDHQPILGSTLRRTCGLNIDIEGVNISSNGISWLQTVVVGTKIDFILLYKQSQYVSCMVYQNKRNIGTHLVSLGFASVEPYNFSLESYKDYRKYYKSLLQEEDKAEKQGAGMWLENEKRSWLLEFILSKMHVFKPSKLLLL